MSNNNVTVYAPDGTAVKASRLNAYDLVNGSGYSWKKGVPTTPAAMPSYRVTKPVGAEPAQAVLDAAGGKVERAAASDDAGETAADADLDQGADADAGTEAAAEAEADADSDAAAEDETAGEDAAPARKSRSRKPAAE